MVDPWSVIDAMVSELGALYALEVEAANFPHVASDPAFVTVHLALVRATEAMVRVAGVASGEPRGLDHAREALDSAAGAAESARRLIEQARAERNRPR